MFDGLREGWERFKSRGRAEREVQDLPDLPPMTETEAAALIAESVESATGDVEEDYIPSSLEARGREALLKESAPINVAYSGLSSHDNYYSEQRRRNLTERIQDDMLEVSHAMYKFNPLASRAVNITAEYVVGDGIGFTAKSKKVYDILARHWDDPINRWSVLQLDRVRDLGLTGEAIFPAYVNPENGHVTLGYIDPRTVDMILVDPNNGMKEYAVILRQRTEYTSSMDMKDNRRRAYRIISVADDVSPESPVYGKRVGLPKDQEQAIEWGIDAWEGKIENLEYPAALAISSSAGLQVEWVGQCFYTKTNSPMGATRGWSDLLPALDWIDAHDQYLFANVEKGINASRYIVDIMLTGMSEPQQREWLARNRQLFTAGQWFTHNENVELNFDSPDLKTEETGAFAEVLKNQSLSGVGHPPIWYAESGASRASAPEMTEPSFKHIRTRQREYAYLISEIFRFCLDMAEVTGYERFSEAAPSPSPSAAGGGGTGGGGSSTSNPSTAGRGQSGQGGSGQPGQPGMLGMMEPPEVKLPEDHTSDRDFYLRMPDVSAKDQRMLSISVNNVASALSTMKSIGYPAEEAVRVFARYLELLGMDAWKMEPESDDVDNDDSMYSLSHVMRTGGSIQEAVERLEESKRGSVGFDHEDEFTRYGNTYYKFRG